MKIISRYILRESFVFFALSLFSFTSLLLTLRILKFAGMIINKGVSIKQIALIFLAIVPTFLEFALPMAAVLGVMLAFARLSGDSEIIVLRSSGVSLTQLIWPVAIFGIFAGLLNLYVSIELRPWGFRTLSQGLFEIARSKTTSGLTEGIFNKLQNLTLYAEKIDYRTGELTHVLIDDRRDPNSRKIVSASMGMIQSDDAQRTVTFFLRDGMIHELNLGRYVLTDFVRNNIVLSPEDLNSSNATSNDQPPRELYLSDLLAQISSIKTALKELPETTASESKTLSPAASAAANPQEAVKALASGKIPTPPPVVTRDELKKRLSKFTAELGARFSLPYASFILALLAMPLGIYPPRAQRTWGIGLSAALGLVVFVIYFGLFSVTSALGEHGRINPYLGLWGPNLLATAITVFFLKKVTSEEWQSVTIGIERAVLFVARLLRIKPKAV